MGRGGRGGGFRISEPVVCSLSDCTGSALCSADLEWMVAGMHIAIRHSKTDQLLHGQVAVLHRAAEEEHCP